MYGCGDGWMDGYTSVLLGCEIYNHLMEDILTP